MGGCYRLLFTLFWGSALQAGTVPPCTTKPVVKLKCPRPLAPEVSPAGALAPAFSVLLPEYKYEYGSYWSCAARM